MIFGPMVEEGAGWIVKYSDAEMETILGFLERNREILQRHTPRVMTLAADWLGAVWVRALASLGMGTDWHRGAMVCTAWCRQVCFAGLGPGEVTTGGQKVVGIAQRRTRAGSLFQCAALLRWDPQRMVNLLGLDAGATAELARMATPVNAAAPDIEDAFVGAIGAEASGSA